MQLGEQYEHLRAVSRHLRRVVDRASQFYATLDLSDTLANVNAAVVELTAATQVGHVDVCICPNLRIRAVSGALLLRAHAACSLSIPVQ